MKRKQKISPETLEIMRSVWCDRTVSISKIAQRMTNRGCGVGRMFNHVRKMKTCSCFSDFVLLKLILYELCRMEKLPSKEKIRHHFRTKVSKEDWKGVPKRQILEKLYFPDQ